MKKFSDKIIALCLCAVLAVSGAAITAFASNTQASEPEKEAEEPAAAGTNDSAASKDETVYVIAGADGSVQKIIVSDWIKNTLGASSLNDKTDLTDIENVKGDESCTLGSGGSRVWDAQGNDIYYQGNIDKELPVGMSVTYTLDGKPISPEDLAGKSGKVTIRFDYQNRQYEMVDIDGEKQKIYVPFVVLTGIVLDNEVFTNVEVSNGKLINDGSRTAVIGLAFPGLQENLAISKDKFEIPSYVELTADAKDFALGMTVTLATNEPFNEIDIGGFDSASELSGSAVTLSDAMDQLLDGSSQLSDGLSTLLDKSGELAAGIDELAAGVGELKSGAGSLNSGAAAIRSGAAQLSDGLNTIVSNNDSLNGGAKQVFESLLSAANTQLAAAGLDVPALTIDNYAEVLNNIIISLDKNAVYKQVLDSVTAAVETQRDYIEQQVSVGIQGEAAELVTTAVEKQVAAQVTAAVRDAVSKQVIESALHMDKASYDAAVAGGQIDEATQASVEAAIDEEMRTAKVQEEIQAKTDEQMSSQAIRETIAAKVNEEIEKNTESQIQKIISENMASSEVQSQLSSASESAKPVIALKSSLDSYNTFYFGLQTYTAGVSNAAAGADALKDGTADLNVGTSELYDGVCELNDGIFTLKNGTPTLIDGITQLRDGAVLLSDGLTEFNEQGIKKLVEAVDGDLDGLAARLNATMDVSQNYRTFAGADEEMDSQVKFVYRTDSIG